LFTPHFLSATACMLSLKDIRKLEIQGEELTMRELNNVEVEEVSGGFKELGRMVGNAQNKIEAAVGVAISTAHGQLKNYMYQRAM